MFTFRTVEAREVNIVGMVKADNKVYFKATKSNQQLQGILNKSIGQNRYYMNNMSCTTVMESIKKLRDTKYKVTFKP
jgi:2C-methyl-D-erythritol 2,4-cyclodiphosphate synthase